MLAQKWDMKNDPTGWWISEKLDGVRAYWDGKHFYSRLGNQFPAPEWFKQGLPPSPLDGELWCGRRMFRRCLSIVRNRASGELWEYITYLVFDAPASREPYEDRVEHIKRTVLPIAKPIRSGAAGSSDGAAPAGGRDGCPYASPVGVALCTGREHLERELALVDGKGGEGLMLRQAASRYENKRSNTLRKVKQLHDEEAKVVGHEGGRGARGFHTGALTLETPDGRQFSCGSGMTAEDRRNPPALGTVVTYRFTELMDNGYPRFPVYIGPRIDMDWATVCASYSAPRPADYAGGELKKKHSILFADDTLSCALTLKLKSLPAAAVPGEAPGEALGWASEGSEGGATDEEGGGGDSPRAKQCVREFAEASEPGGPSGAGSAGGGALMRSRSQCLAAETGLDIAVARTLLNEHDEAAGDSME